MLRKCIRLDIKKIENSLGISNKNIEIYIDKDNRKNVIAFMKKEYKKTRRIFYEILSSRYNRDLYSKEEISKRTKGITAMKYKGKSRHNMRIFCKEYFDNMTNKKIVIISTYKKKSNKSKKWRNYIEKIGGYHYEF